MHGARGLTFGKGPGHAKTSETLALQGCTNHLPVCFPSADASVKAYVASPPLLTALAKKLSRLSWELDQWPGNIGPRLCDGFLGVNEIS